MNDKIIVDDVINDLSNTAKYIKKQAEEIKLLKEKFSCDHETKKQYIERLEAKDRIIEKRDNRIRELQEKLKQYKLKFGEL